jgi:transposase-like protein
MNETSVVGERRRWTQAEADRLVVEYEQSGMTRKAFSRMRGISLQILDYHRYKRRNRAQPGLAQLLPVELLAAQNTGTGELQAEARSLRVELANGRRIVVEEGFSATLLQRVVAVLEA